MARSVASAGSTFMHGRFLGRNTFQLFAAQILTRWLFAISANVNEFHFFSFFRSILRALSLTCARAAEFVAHR